MHHNVDADVPLLKAGIERYGGQLYNLSAEDAEWSDPPGPVDAQRAAIVAGVLTGVANALPGTVEISERRSRVVAGIKGLPDAASTSRSLRTILRAAAVVSSDALARSEITILVAGMEDADSGRSELLWRLLTVDPSVLSLTGKRTIVGLLSGRFDPAVDLRRQPRIDYIARDDRILKRTQWPTSGALRTIEAHEGPVVLFLGAGASAGARISLGDVYRDVALRELLGGDVDDELLADRFFEYLHGMDRFIGDERQNRSAFLRTLTLERVLRETFHELGDRPRAQTQIVRTISDECERALSFRSEGHEAIHDLIRAKKRPIVFMTVNFDRLIENGVENVTQVLRRPEEFAAARESVEAYVAGDLDQPVPIFKLHGSIEEPDSMVASIDTTAAGLHDDVRSALNVVVKDGHVPWVWIGCSMRDRDMNAWLSGIGNDNLDEWWVDPFPGRSLDAFFSEHRQAAWDQTSRTLQSRLIVDSSDNFLQRLNGRLR
ncbi:SIR2 family protein [Modestobacter sp. SSW1-42]|uniref:SIR2 family protein n=1 Tax=Modestobacter sp. SSW1-42 TaxID=596372 RepID=UPI0039880F15